MSAATTAFLRSGRRMRATGCTADYCQPARAFFTRASHVFGLFARSRVCWIQTYTFDYICELAKFTWLCHYLPHPRRHLDQIGSTSVAGNTATPARTLSVSRMPLNSPVVPTVVTRIGSPGLRRGLSSSSSRELEFQGRQTFGPPVTNPRSFSRSCRAGRGQTGLLFRTPGPGGQRPLYPR
jgi:hypothetical protein